MELFGLVKFLLGVWCAGEPSADIPGDIYRLFASKTAYDQVRSRQAIREYNIPGCIPKQFYLLSRHGIRYPPKNTIEEMQEFLPFLQKEILQHQSLLPGNLNELRKWHLLLDSTYDMKLSPSGYKELQELAARYKQRFPGLLNRTYSDKYFNTFFTSAERTNSSMKQLLSGFFGSQVANTVVSDPSKENDKLLRSYKNCGKSQQLDDSLYSEHDKFVVGPEMTALLQNVTQRLQLKWCLSYHGLNMIYDICRYESAWNPNNPSPWCTIFTEDDLKLLEYGEDLQSYYDHGYGQAVNSEHACPPVQDLVNHFRSAAAAEAEAPVGIFRVSHSQLLLKVFSRLGLFQDEVPLRSDNYREQKKRLWRTSLINSFSSNIALVLLQCDTSDDGYRVTAFVQEEEVELPGCCCKPCPLAEFLEAYGPFADNCSMENICSKTYRFSK